MSGGRRFPWSPVFVVLGLAVAIAAPHVFTGLAAQHLLVIIAINVILVASLDLLVGGAGMISLGHAAFMGVGAYASAILVRGGASFPLGLLAAFGFAALAGLVVGVPALRLKGHYFSVVTFITGIIATILMTNLVSLTRGPMGLPGIPFASIEFLGIDHTFRSIVFKVGFYYLALAFAVLTLLVRWRLGRSRFGRALAAIKGDENLAESVGIATYRTKVTAFVLAAAIAGVAGSLYAHYVVAIDYGHFDPLYGTFLIWVMLMLGGSGNNRGAVLGALLVWAIWTGASFAVDALRPTLAAISPDLPQRGPYVRFLLISLLMLFIVLYRPRGVLPEEKVVSLTRD